MNIRQFAQLCRRAAAQEDCAGHVPTDQAALMLLTRMAKTHRVLPLLALALGQEACRVAAIPALQTPLHHTTRNMRIKAQVLELDRALEGSGHGAILLKGAVALFDPVYPDIGARYMADIDLLLRDPACASVLHRRGYVPNDPDFQDQFDSDGKPMLTQGGFHLAPLIRPGDLVAMEPHLLAGAPQFRHLLPPDLATDVMPVPGCRNLLQPSRPNHLIVSLIHTLKHDRDALDGGLLIRGLIECELLHRRLTPDEQAAIARHFAACGAKSMYGAWRALADWLFRDDAAAAWRSVAAWLLIAEFRWRARGYRAVFAISVAHRLLAPLHIQYWTSMTFVSHARRLVQKDFWARFFNRFGKAYKD